MLHFLTQRYSSIQANLMSGRIKYRFRHWLITSLLGLSIGGIGLVVKQYGGMAPVRTMLSASDYLMLDESGPRLGGRAASDDIVIVTYGEECANKLGTKPVLSTDMELYRNLLEAGATVIADCRVIACPTVPEYEMELEPLFQALSELENSQGRVFRDISVTMEIDLDRIQPYLTYIAHNAVNYRSVATPIFQPRLYPLAYCDYLSMQESMAVRAARQHEGLEPATKEQIAANLKSSGMSYMWQAQHPAMVSLLGEPPETFEAGPYQIGDHKINWHGFQTTYLAVSPGAVWIDYSVSPKGFPRLRYGDIVKGELDPKDVRGKIVIVGLSVDFIPAMDRFLIPTQMEQTSEMDVLACAIQTILSDRNLKESPTWLKYPIMLVGVLLFSWATAIRRLPIAVCTVVALMATYFAVMTYVYRQCYFTDVVIAPIAFFAATLASGGYRYLGEIQSRKRVTEMFGRYVPRAVVTQLVQKPDIEEMIFEGRKREVSVLFADIRGFTRYTEDHAPELVLEQLNELLSIMVDCTFSNEGTVDKFIGDAILVLFNAPTDQADHATRAVRTAWAIQSALKDHPSGLSIGIGIHTGQAVVGNVGTPKRMEYTAIGSTVNIASRL
ncbi:MAG: adenylate/guanylate cyclase domain-containing protein, partial [Planctomycetales bacterium]|nr:adenylate/guanylate cyclase domain-containing protein [Planctomycetales bacterium]